LRPEIRKPRPCIKNHHQNVPAQRTGQKLPNQVA